MKLILAALAPIFTLFNKIWDSISRFKKKSAHEKVLEANNNDDLDAVRDGLNRKLRRKKKSR